MDATKNSEGLPAKNPQEELANLRAEVARREQQLAQETARPLTGAEREQVAAEQIQQHQAAPVDAVLHPQAQMPAGEVQGIVLKLSPEPHDSRMTELLTVLTDKGIKNAMRVVEGLNDPHIQSDFHRFLVQYVKGNYPVPGLAPRSALFDALHMTLYEISLPDSGGPEGSGQRPLKELVSAMEQLYAGMFPTTSSKGKSILESLWQSTESLPPFTLEIANSNHSQEAVVYAGIPDARKDLFEKQVVALFPRARLKEVPDDYNIFAEPGEMMGAVATLDKFPIYPLKMYDKFDHDPLNVILNTFSKIEKENEGAAVQLVFRQPRESYQKQYQKIIEGVAQGKPIKELLPKSLGEEFLSGVSDMIFSSGAAEQKKKEEEKKRQMATGELPKAPIADQNLLAVLQEKIAAPICEVAIRVLVSANTPMAAEAILTQLQSAFSQFENTLGNKLVFKKLTGKKLATLAEQFSFREFPEAGEKKQILPLNFKEAATLFHFPERIGGSAPQVRQAKSAASAAPVDLPQQGTLLGINRFRNGETKAFITKEDRLRHFYVIGQTGTGKTTLLKNMIVQDIQQGEGVCMIDPHGMDILDVLANVPKERYEDVIYFDPSYTARPMGLNMLEFDPNFPEQKTFVVNELLSIFKKLYGAVPESMGPAFEQYFRNSALLVMEHPESGNTLLDISRVLSDKEYRKLKLAHCKNPLILQFWTNAEKTTGEQGLANYVQYVTNKFDVFLSNDIMRPVVSQEHSSFNFRDVMDNKKILLVNLAKGKLGDINANLIGLILVGKILMAALSRTDSSSISLPPFYLYIDEFQNVTTDSIATILSEARKYKLSLTIAHQFIAQLQENIRDAVFGNVGSLGVFRVGSADAEILVKQLAPTFTAHDIVNIDNRNAYLKILVNGRPTTPFNIETLPPPPGDPSKLDALKQLSYLKYGREKALVEQEILVKYRKIEPATPPPAPAQVSSNPTPNTAAKV